MKTLSILLLILVSLTPVSVFADTPIDDSTDAVSTIEPCVVGSVIKCGGHEEGDEHSLTLEQVVSDLLVGFEVDSIKELDCEAIVDHDFEHVGEAFMSYMHPDEEEHERIDSMIGGEGSESLESMHVFMGKRYLGCTDGSYGPMMMNFTSGGGVSGPGMMSNYWAGSMMAGWWSPFNSFSWVTFGLYLALFIFAGFGVVYVIQLIVRNCKK